MPPEFLTTKELAELLRIKERKIYDLAASGALPCSRATGKLLFPKTAIDAWIADNSTGTQRPIAVERPNVFLGSHDPLLDWALRESQVGLATNFDSSLDGLDRFEKNQGIATGLHAYDPANKVWNVPFVRDKFAESNVVLIEWAERQRGLLLKPELKNSVKTISQIKNHRIAPRQDSAGSQILLRVLINQAGLDPAKLNFTAPTRTETDAAIAVKEDHADIAFGLEVQAGHFGLGFQPIIRERFDLLIDRQHYFEPAIQNLLAFCKSAEFCKKASTMPGYDISHLGRVHFNG